MDDPWASTAWSDDPLPSSSSATASSHTTPWTSPVVASTSSTGGFASAWTDDAHGPDAGVSNRTVEETVEDWAAASSPIVSSTSDAGWATNAQPTLSPAVRSTRSGSFAGVPVADEGFEEVSFAAAATTASPVEERSGPAFRRQSTSSSVLQADAGISAFPDYQAAPLHTASEAPATEPALKAADDDDWGDFGTVSLPEPDAPELSSALPTWTAPSAPAEREPEPEPEPESWEPQRDQTPIGVPEPSWQAEESKPAASPVKTTEDAWAAAADESSARRAALRRIDPDRLATLLVETRTWAAEAFPLKPDTGDDTFLPPGQAAMTMNVLGAMNDTDGEISATYQSLSSPPVFDPSSSTGLVASTNETTGLRRISLLFQGSVSQQLFRAGLDATRLHAAETAARLSASAPPRLTPQHLRGPPRKDDSLWGSPASMAMPTPNNPATARFAREPPIGSARDPPVAAAPAGWFSRWRTASGDGDAAASAAEPDFSEAPPEASRMSRFLNRFSRNTNSPPPPTPTSASAPAPTKTIEASASTATAHSRVREPSGPQPYRDWRPETSAQGPYDRRSSPAVRYEAEEDTSPAVKPQSLVDDDDKPLGTLAKAQAQAPREDEDLFGLFSPGMPPQPLAAPPRHAASPTFDAFGDFDDFSSAAPPQSKSPVVRSPRANGSANFSDADLFGGVVGAPKSAPMTTLSSNGSGGSGPARIPTPVMTANASRAPMPRMTGGQTAGATALKAALPTLAPPARTGSISSSRPTSATASPVTTGGLASPTAFADFGNFGAPALGPSRPSLAQQTSDDLFGSFSGAVPTSSLSAAPSPRTMAAPAKQPPGGAAPGAPLSQQDLSFFESLL